MMYAKLTSLQTMLFDLKTYRSDESFVVERYTQIRHLDENCSGVQLCTCITTLIPVLQDRHLSTARIGGLVDLLEAVR